MTTLNALFAKTIQKLGVGKGLAKEGTWSFILRASNTGLGFISTVLLARWLGTEGYGIYAYALAWTSVLAIPAQAGLPHLVVRETALGMANNRPDLVKGIWRWAGQMVAILSVGIAVIFGAIFFLGQAEAGSAQALTMAWALVLLPVSVLGDLRGAALRGLKRILPGQLPEFVIRPGLLIFFVLGAGWLASDQFSPDLAMMLNVGAALAAFATGAWMLWKNTPESVRQALPVSDGKKWLVSSLMFALMSSFSVINKQVSTITLGFFATPDQIGIYKVAVQMATLAAFGLQAVTTVVSPRFADLYAQNKMERLQELATGSARITLAVNVLLTILFAIIGQPFFMVIFGSEFSASYLPLLILLIGQTANASTGPVAFLLNMTGHEKDTMRGIAVAAGVNILLNLLMIPQWGIQGAAAATAIATVIWNAILWWVAKKRLGINSFAFYQSLKKN